MYADENICAKSMAPSFLFVWDFSGGKPKYKGITDEGLETLKRLRDALRLRSVLFEREFFQRTTIHHVGMTARAFAGNVLMYGPPGGTKTGMANFFVHGERAFKIQMNQMMPETPIIGGVPEKSLKEGKYDLNVTESMATFPVAIVDEFHQANPQVLQTLFGIANPTDRKVSAGKRVVKAATETIFSTSNANLFDLHETFRLRGQGRLCRSSYGQNAF